MPTHITRHRSYGATAQSLAAILLIAGAPAGADRASAASPSFDCAKARTPTEIQICQSARLSELDSVLAEGYAFVKSTHGRPAADQIGIPHWKLIGQCDSDRDCIRRRQIDEIEALRAAGAPISLPAWAVERATPPTDGSAKPQSGEGKLSTSQYKALTGVIIRARCHMNSCQWFRIDQSTLVRDAAGKSLFEIKASNWESEYPDGNYEAVRPREFIDTDTSYVICSRQDPSIIWKDEDSGWRQSQLAPGARGGIFGASESAVAVYWAACHAMNVQDVYAATAMANKLGYPKTAGTDIATDRKLADPEDGFGAH